jgi:hypothetical protein
MLAHRSVETRTHEHLPGDVVLQIASLSALLVVAKDRFYQEQDS